MAAKKYNRSDMSTLLSKAVSIEEIIIETVSEIAGKKIDEVSEAFKVSKCHKNLFDFQSEYYLNDINILVADFLREVHEELGWKI